MNREIIFSLNIPSMRLKNMLKIFSKQGNITHIRIAFVCDNIVIDAPSIIESQQTQCSYQSIVISRLFIQSYIREDAKDISYIVDYEPFTVFISTMAAKSVDILSISLDTAMQLYISDGTLVNWIPGVILRSNIENNEYNILARYAFAVSYNPYNLDFITNIKIKDLMRLNKYGHKHNISLFMSRGVIITQFKTGDFIHEWDIDNISDGKYIGISMMMQDIINISTIVANNDTYAAFVYSPDDNIVMLIISYANDHSIRLLFHNVKIYTKDELTVQLNLTNG